MSQLGGLTKRPRNQHRRIRTTNIKPPEQRLVGTKTVCSVRYVTTDHKERKLPCTPEVFHRVLGKRSKTRAHSGLDMQIYHRFVLVQDVETNLVEGIDGYPFRQALHGLKREDEPVHGMLVVSINPQTGDMMVEDIPGEVREAHILALMEELDPVGQINVGEEFAGFTATSIAGGRIYFATDDLTDLGEMLNEDAIFLAQAPNTERVGTGGRGLASGAGGVGFVTPTGGGVGGDIHTGNGR